MKSSNQTNDKVCQETQSLLSDYIDNTLSARQVWAVEKHLTLCADCAAVMHQMQTTVELLRSADRFDTGDDFMARLHARLDGLEPEPMRKPSPIMALRDWLAGARAGLQARRIPALSLGMASL